MTQEKKPSVLARAAYTIAVAGILAAAGILVDTQRVDAVQNNRIDNLERGMEKIDKLNDKLDETNQNVSALNAKIDKTEYENAPRNR